MICEKELGSLNEGKCVALKVLVAVVRSWFYKMGARFQRGLRMMGKGRRLRMDGGNGEF